MGLFDGISDAWGGLWDSVSGNDAKRAQEDAMRNAQGYNQSALDAQQAAAQKELEFQRILAYFQMQQANQANTQGNTLAAQGLAGTLANQQNQANQFAQLYNQQQANNLPQQMAGLASLQALTPLMQMTGMQGYQMPTTIDTTKMVAPDIIGQFDTLSSKYASQYNNPATQQAQQQQSADFLKAMSDPAAWLASQGATGTAAATTGGTQLPGWVPNPGATGAADAFMAPPTQIQPTPPTQTAPVAPVATPETTSLQLAAGPAQGSRVEDSDIYRFNLEQAQRAMNNQLAGRGLAGGGAQTKAQTDLALSMARDESQNQYNRLMALTQLGMGMQPSQQPANAAGQLSSMYNQNAQNTNNALSNISQAQNQAAQNRSGMFTNLANAYGQNAANQSNALSNFYQANAGAAQQYGNWQAQQPSGLSRMIDLGTKIYGASQGFGGGGGSSFGRFGASGTWSNPTSDYYLANTPAY